MLPQKEEPNLWPWHTSLSPTPTPWLCLSSTASRTRWRYWVGVLETFCNPSVVDSLQRVFSAGNVTSVENTGPVFSNHLFILLMHSGWWDSGWTWCLHSSQTHLPHSGSWRTHWSHCIIVRIWSFCVKLEWPTGYLQGWVYWISKEVNLLWRLLESEARTISSVLSPTEKSRYTKMCSGCFPAVPFSPENQTMNVKEECGQVSLLKAKQMRTWNFYLTC